MFAHLIYAGLASEFRYIGIYIHMNAGFQAFNVQFLRYMLMENYVSVS